MFERYNYYTSVALFLIVGLSMFINVTSADEYICDDCCSPGYIDYYRCSDSNRERLWENSDCSREWRLVSICKYGCTDGSCLDCPTELTGVSVLTPSDMFEDSEVEVTVKIENNADQGRMYYLDAYICNFDSKCTSTSGSCFTNCVDMDSSDSSVYVGGHRTRYVDFSKFVGRIGNYGIKVKYTTDPSRDYSVSGSGDCGTVAYSTPFTVFSKLQSDVDIDGKYYGNEYRCFNDYKQRKYAKNVEGEMQWRWEILEYCEYGCEDGNCISGTSSSADRSGEPKIFVQPKYNVDRCEDAEIEFSILNTGDTGNFEIEIYGEPSGWMGEVDDVKISHGEIKDLSSHISIPCNAVPGEYEFVVKAGSKMVDTHSSVVVINGGQHGLFTRDLYNIFILLVFGVIVGFVVRRIVLYRSSYTIEEERFH